MTLEMIPLFRLLDRVELQALRVITQERQFAARQEIFKEGAPGDGVYFVRSGLVEISAGARVFSRLGPGEFFGEMAVIEHRPRSASATAAVDTEVFFLPRGELLTFIERSPALSFALLQQISNRLREFNHLFVRELVQTESLALIGKFAQGIVHDLKNPLSIISLSAEMLDMPGVSTELRVKSRKRIQKQVERVTDMVSDILIYTRSERRDSEYQPGDYAAFVRELISDLQVEAEAKESKIVLEDLPATVMVRFDPRRLRRIFFNLIHNATDAMMNGGVIFARFDLRDNEILTEIEDTGPGIAREVADRLFQPFASHGKAHGTGLGLSICKRIAEDHGGKISARSESGRGAVFAFTLPLLK